MVDSKSSKGEGRLGYFRFHDDLTIFLQDKTDNGCVTIRFKGHETVKHLIESLGVPHTEVDVILVNGNSVGFDWRPQNGDKIYVYAQIDNLVLKSLQRLKPESEGKPRFVLDGHLGKLASYLRLLGYDAK